MTDYLCSNRNVNPSNRVQKSRGSASVFQPWIWESSGQSFPRARGTSIQTSCERSSAWMYLCLGSRVAEWFHTRKNEGGGEERFNETPSYGVYLISIHTPSGYASGFWLVCLVDCSRCISVRALPWCWSRGVLQNSRRTVLFIFPQRWSCSMCVPQNTTPSSMLFA